MKERAHARRSALVGLVLGLPLSALFLRLAFRDAVVAEVWSVVTRADLGLPAARSRRVGGRLGGTGPALAISPCRTSRTPSGQVRDPSSSAVPSVDSSTTTVIYGADGELRSDCVGDRRLNGGPFVEHGQEDRELYRRHGDPTTVLGRRRRRSERDMLGHPRRSRTVTAALVSIAAVWNVEPL